MVSEQEAFESMLTRVGVPFTKSDDTFLVDEGTDKRVPCVVIELSPEVDPVLAASTQYSSHLGKFPLVGHTWVTAEFVFVEGSLVMVDMHE